MGIVITANLDYPRLLALLETDRPGVILFRGGSYSDTEMLALLDLASASTTARRASAGRPGSARLAPPRPRRMSALTG